MLVNGATGNSQFYPYHSILLYLACENWNNPEAYGWMNLLKFYKGTEIKTKHNKLLHIFYGIYCSYSYVWQIGYWKIYVFL